MNVFKYVHGSQDIHTFRSLDWAFCEMEDALLYRSANITEQKSRCASAEKSDGASHFVTRLMRMPIIRFIHVPQLGQQPLVSDQETVMALI